MSKIKHSKYKNTGILFELIVSQITSDTLEGENSPLKEILQKYFVKTELGREYKLYKTLLERTSLTEGKADIIINTLLESSKSLNRRVIKKQKYNLINEIKKYYDLRKFFNHKLPHYKVQAAFYTLMEIYNQKSLADSDYIIANKITILEHLTAAPIEKQKVKDTLLEEFRKEDKETRLLTCKILLEKFNEKYDSLGENQKKFLRKLITTGDNQSLLKEFYIEQSTKVKTELITLNKSTTDPTTKIKIDEIINLVDKGNNSRIISDDNLVNLLQYYDLIRELKVANAT